jgi:hypothetical protein
MMKDWKIQFVIMALVVSTCSAFMMPKSDPVIKRDRDILDVLIGPVNNGQAGVDLSKPYYVPFVRPTGYGYNYYATAIDVIDEKPIKGGVTKFRINIPAFQAKTFPGYVSYPEDFKYLKYDKYVDSGQDGYCTFNITIRWNSESCENSELKYNHRTVGIKAKSGQRSSEGIALGQFEFGHGDRPDYWAKDDNNNGIMEEQGFFWGGVGGWGNGWKAFPGFKKVTIGGPVKPLPGEEHLSGTVTVSDTAVTYATEDAIATVTAVGWGDDIPASQTEFKGNDIEVAPDELAFLNDMSIATPESGLAFIGPVQWRYIQHVVLKDEHGYDVITDRETTENLNDSGGLWIPDTRDGDVDFKIKCLGGWYMPEMWATTAEPFDIDPNNTIMDVAVTCPGYCTDPNNDPNVVFPMQFYIAESSDDGLRHLIRPYNNYIAFTDANGIGFEPYPIEFTETDPDITIWHLPFWDDTKIKFNINQAVMLVYPFWLTSNATGDFNQDGTVNLVDWSIAATPEPTPYPWVSATIPAPLPLVDDTAIRAAIDDALANPDVTFNELAELLTQANDLIAIAPPRQQASLLELRERLLNKIMEIMGL